MQQERGRSPGDRIPLSQVKKGIIYDGSVKSRSSRKGVLVDFGAETNGALQIRGDCINSYKTGMKLTNMTVISCNPDSGMVWLRPDPATAPGPSEGPPTSSPPTSARSSFSGRRGRSRRGSSRTRTGSTASSARSRRSRGPRQNSARRRSNSRARREWDHPEGKSLEDFQDGMMVDGEVTGSNKFGVFVNFGATKDGRLLIPKRYQFEFKIGDYISNIQIDHIDRGSKRITLSLLDLDGMLETLMNDRVPLEELQEGMRLDGIISNVGPFGVFVHVGAARDGKLRVPRRVQEKMLSGERVKGLRVESINLRRQRFSLAFIEDEEEEEEVESPSPSPSPSDSASPGPESGENASPRRTKPGGLVGAGRRQLPPPPVEEPPLEDDCIALEDIQVGEMANGVVMNINKGGAMVDIGAEVLGLLLLPHDLRRQFQVSDMVEGMVVEQVDVEKRQVQLSMDDPELAVLDNRQVLPLENRPMMSLENGVRLEQLEPPVPIRQVKAKGKARPAYRDGR